MICPECGNIGEHSVIKTDPKQYYWSDKKSKLFNRLTGKDINYRKRTKSCENCKAIFETFEMPDIYFRALMSELEKYEIKYKKLNDTILNLSEKLNSIAKENLSTLD